MCQKKRGERVLCQQVGKALKTTGKTFQTHSEKKEREKKQILITQTK
jgi:hypothetical protein